MHIKMTDRAGNTSEDELIFSIDKTKPEIKIAFDNKVLFALNFEVSVMMKQAKNISRGIPKAKVQFGLLVVDIVIEINFKMTAIQSYAKSFVYLFRHPIRDDSKLKSWFWFWCCHIIHLEF